MWERVPWRGSCRGRCRQSQSCLQSVPRGHQLPPALPSVRKRVRAALHLPWDSGVPPGPGWLLGHPTPTLGARGWMSSTLLAGVQGLAVGSTGAPRGSVVQEDQTTMVAGDNSVGSCGSQQDRHCDCSHGWVQTHLLPARWAQQNPKYSSSCSSPGAGFLPRLGGAPSARLLPRFGYLL